MTHTNQEQVNDGWTVNKKRRRGVEEDGDHMETEEECRKFGINLGNFRTKADVLTVLHLKYPWVKVHRRLTRTRFALLVCKDNWSQKLLMEVKSFNDKKCSFQPVETTFRKTYIILGVPSCITEELLLKDEEVLEASRMTKWMNKTQTTTTTDMMKVALHQGTQNLHNI